ncbi:MAG: sugar-binding transcriptional regulator [Thermoleophilaceae bacterium]|nr:sugar-binding transcriptional regulator [Thermoleophilaceae bacterium]
MSDQNLTLKACYQHYRRGLSQTEIAANLRLSRFQVARLLRAGLEEGYVTVKILEPARWHPELERAIEERFGLKAVIVVDNDGLEEEEVKLRVADAAGRYLIDLLEDGDVLGISLGSTVQALIDQLPDRIRKEVEVVQLIGGSSRMESELNSMILAAQLARRFGSRSHLLFAPALVSRGDLRESLLADGTIEATFAMFSRLTVAVLGVGAFAQGGTSRLVYGEIVDDALFPKLLARGAVGDVLSYVYRDDGTVLAGGVEDRLIAISLDDVLRVPHRIAVAAGRAKARAIAGALRGGFVNVLVTDSAAAAAICEQTEGAGAAKATG